jgi:hypothetical protein
MRNHNNQQSRQDYLNLAVVNEFFGALQHGGHFVKVSKKWIFSQENVPKWRLVFEFHTTRRNKTSFTKCPMSPVFEQDGRL